MFRYFSGAVLGDPVRFEQGAERRGAEAVPHLGRVARLVTRDGELGQEGKERRAGHYTASPVINA